MRLKAVGILGCALALCIVLVGCGSGIDKSRYAGDWTLTSSSIENFDADSLAAAQSLGLEVKLWLDEDGTGTFTMLSEVKDVTWEAESDTEGTLVIDSTSKAKMEAGDSQLTLVDGSGDTMTFGRP